MTMIRTVLGDIPPSELGVTDAHDHLFFVSAALPGQELDDPDAALRELRTFADAGGQALVHWTPRGLGHDGLAEISRAAGVHIVAATGLHQPIHYASPPALDGLEEAFIADITDGRAGIVKVAGQYHSLGVHEERTFAAAAMAARETGIPVCVHTELGTHADVILERLGLEPGRVVLGHLNRNPDAGLHVELARAGAFLAYDGPSRANHVTDWRLFDLLHRMAEENLLDQILLGADTTTRAATVTAGGGPGMRGLLTQTRARVVRELGSAAADTIFVRNPAKAFALRPSGNASVR
jgi:predicted metal-dependent phosphotriesterase family hydrolase